MPRQMSIIPLSGRMGDVVYYYRKNRKNQKKYLARRAPATVTQTPATKRAAADFGIASKSSGLIRRAMHEYTQLCPDHSLHYNLNKKMGEILRADVNHPLGQRVFTAANLQSLQHFRFNSEAGIQYTTLIENNAPGDINISFPDGFSNKSNTTHITIKAIALLVNFAKNTTQQVESNTVVIKRGEKAAALTLNINRRNLTLIILEIQSCYEVNGRLYASQNSKAHALDVIEVLAPVEAPREPKIKYRNKAPHFWVPYAAPATPALIITHVNYISLPEG
jgi:hypothetical protein